MNFTGRVAFFFLRRLEKVKLYHKVFDPNDTGDSFASFIFLSCHFPPFVLIFLIPRDGLSVNLF